MIQSLQKKKVEEDPCPQYDATLKFSRVSEVLQGEIFCKVTGLKICPIGIFKTKLFLNHYTQVSVLTSKE